MTATIGTGDFCEYSADEFAELSKYRKQEASRKIRERYINVDGLCRKLGTDKENGIDESTVALRQLRFGVNAAPPPKSKPFWHLVLEASKDTTLLILVISAVVSFGLSFYNPPTQSFFTRNYSPDFDYPTKEGPKDADWIQGAAIITAVLVVILVTSFNEYSKENQFRALQARVARTHVTNVIRGGEQLRLDSKDIVVGDICLLTYGDIVPADGVLLRGHNLHIDESTLTGESDLVIKSVDADPILLSGTSVMEGTGHMIVTAVGSRSQTGQILSLIETAKPKEKEKDDSSEGTGGERSRQRSVFQSKLSKLAIYIGYVGTAAAGVTILVLFIRYTIVTFAIDKEPWDTTHLQFYVHFIIIGVTIIVVAVPEGLPLSVTISLAYSVRKMLKDKNLVRHLDACETMGNATAICCDKTGTLTTNRMTVTQWYIEGQLETDYSSWKDVTSSTSSLLAENLSVNSSETSILHVNAKTSAVSHQGDKTECALLEFLWNVGENYKQFRGCIQPTDVLKVYTFSSYRKFMATVVRYPNQQILRVYVKGAPEVVLARCKKILEHSGEIRQLELSEIRQLTEEVSGTMAKSGLRTLCAAYRDLPLSVYPEISQRWDKEDDSVVKDLTCISLLGIEDPLRPEVSEAVRKCKKAGIVVTMITGDNTFTAVSVAQKCGILKPGDCSAAMDTNEFNLIVRNRSGVVQQDLFDKVWPHLRVLARATPRDKLVLVNGILRSRKRRGEVVAVTGDGTNDAPALKAADVGFAMGIGGSDVAKEASDIIITDDNFASIVKAVMWGRNVYDSVAKFLQFQLTATAVTVLISLAAAIFIENNPIKAVQMLWVNLIIDALASLALATEDPSEQLLRRKPYSRHQSVISRTMLKNIVGHAFYQTVVLFVVLFYGEKLFETDNGRIAEIQDPPTRHYTIVFNVFVIMNLFNEVNSRKLHGERNPFEGMLRNQLFILILLATAIGQVMIVQYGGYALCTKHLHLDQWLWCVFLGIGELLWAQVIASLPDDLSKVSAFLKRKGRGARIKPPNAACKTNSNDLHKGLCSSNSSSASSRKHSFRFLKSIQNLFWHRDKSPQGVALSENTDAVSYSTFE